MGKPLDLPMFLFPDCEAPLKKEGGLPEGPVLEALLCAETGEKKIELKEEEAIMDCQVGPPPGPLLLWPIAFLLSSFLGSLRPRVSQASMLPHPFSFWKTSCLSQSPSSKQDMDSPLS